MRADLLLGLHTIGATAACRSCWCVVTSKATMYSVRRVRALLFASALILGKHEEAGA